MFRKIRNLADRSSPNSIRVVIGLMALIPLCGAAGNTRPAGEADWPSSPAQNSARFAIADFDGDNLPDMASVQIDQSGTYQSRYRIRFSLSTGLQQTVSVMGPVGGLLIASQDVNGDDFLDLVVKSAWQEQPVAVLLNDGHGNFIAVQPAAFPQIHWKSPSSQFLTVVQLTYPQTASLSRDRQEVCQGGYGWSYPPSAPGASGNSNPTNPPYFELSPKLSRAPPVIFP